jgi:SNF2 family DNA or RNA helicase
LIVINKKNRYIKISATDLSGQDFLNEPLHKLYLKNQLNGTFHPEANEWSFRGDSYGENLQKFINHLAKYNVTFKLDNEAKKIIGDRKDKFEAFNQTISKALISKRKLSAADEKEIVDLLKPEFVRDLKSFQIQGVKHLITIQNGANFSVPGSGKTSVILAYYSILKRNNIVDSLFVIGPTSSFEPWRTEFTLCFDRKPNEIRIAGLRRDEREDIYLYKNKYELFLITYNTASRDVNGIIELFKKKRIFLILDESHYIKNPYGGVHAEAVLKLSKFAVQRSILTGTPMPNGLQDLWTQFTFLFWQELPLGPLNQYLFSLQKKDAKVLLKEIKKKVTPFFFRVKKSDLGLPKPKFKVVNSSLSKLQSRIYRGVALKYLTELKESHTDKQVLRGLRKARYIRLNQIASNPSLLNKYSPEFQIPPLELKGISLDEGIRNYHKYEMPSKVKAVLKLANQIVENDQKVIIWSSFVHNLEMLRNHLTSFNPVVVHGGIPTESNENSELSREQLINKFKYENSCKIFIANPAACAESISLHNVCHHAVYLDRTFNCAQYLQSLDRIHRLGLDPTDSTYYYLVLAKDSIDQIIHRRLKEKTRNLINLVEGDALSEVNGLWDEDLGDEEFIDYDLVDQHIISLFSNAKN